MVCPAMALLLIIYKKKSVDKFYKFVIVVFVTLFGGFGEVWYFICGCDLALSEMFGDPARLKEEWME